MAVADQIEAQDQKVERIVEDAARMGLVVTGFAIAPDGTVTVLTEKPADTPPGDRGA